MLQALYITATLLRSIFLLGIHTGAVEAKDPNIRLAGGDLHRKGRVEVLLDGEWGTICDDDWDYNDAIVFCRQLGFKDVDKVRRDAFFGEGNGQIFMDGIECDGTERSITDCPYTRNHNCIHSEDAGVVCTSDFVELCPSNKTISVTSDVIKARVNWTGPFTGSQDVSTACSHSTGDYYDVGITMVTCSFSSYVHSWTCPFYIAIFPTDYFSNKQFCPMNVTQTIERETNGSHIQVFWSDFTLDQGRYNTSKSHVPGDAFPLGVTRVTYTYYGNAEYVYRVCTFYVHVFEVNTPESTTRHGTGLWFASIILFTTVLLVVTIMFITWRRCSVNHGGDQTAEGMCSTIVADNRRVTTSFQDNRTSFDEADSMHVPMKASCGAQKPSTFSPVHVEEMPIYEEPKQCQIQPKADGPTAYRYVSRVDFA